MKKTIKLLLISAMLVAVLAGLAAAADFTHCADALNEMGLFRGTQNGYELDRAPTRAEAATMLVRLLGAEEEALTLSYTAPFTDVDAWAKPYVQYLYDNNLTKGTSAVTFGHSDKCTALQYATFLLRALGYSDGENGDFAYEDALSFAEKLGVVDSFNCNKENFLRDNVAAMSYTALSCAPKSGEADLLTKLEASGAVKDDKGYIEAFGGYRAYAAASKSYDEADKLSASMKKVEATQLNGEDFTTATFDISFAIDKLLSDASKSKMSISANVKEALSNEGVESLKPILSDMGMDDEEIKLTVNEMRAGISAETEMDIYYADGYMYVSSAEGKGKLRMPFDEAFAEAGMGDFSVLAPICAYKSITADKNLSKGEETYRIEAAEGLMNRIVTAAENSGSASALSSEVVLKNGRVEKMLVEMTFDNVDEIADGVPLGLRYSVELSNIKTGDTVSVKTPENLGSYEEVTIE